MPQFFGKCQILHDIYQTTATSNFPRCPVITGYSYTLNTGPVPDDGDYGIVGEGMRIVEINILEIWDGAREIGNSCVENAPVSATNCVQGFAKLGRGSCNSFNMLTKGYC